MNVHMIWAQDKNGGIGKQGKLPWRLPEDLKNFKRLTTHHPVIMGRVTWDSLPMKPLPGRRNIVLSSKNRHDVESYPDVQSCIHHLERDIVDSVFIIGGAKVYSAFFPLATDLHVTIVAQTESQIDTFIPISKATIRAEFDIKTSLVLSERATYFHWIKKGSRR